MVIDESLTIINPDPNIVIKCGFVFKHYLFKAGHDYICSKCGTDIHDDYDHCLKCGCDFETTISVRKNTNFGKFYEEMWVNVLEKTNDLLTCPNKRLVLVSYIVTKDIGQDYCEEIEINEVQRESIVNGTVFMRSKVLRSSSSGYGLKSTDWIDGYYSDYYMGSSPCKVPRKFINIEPKDFKEYLNDTEVKYSMVWEYIKKSDLTSSFRKIAQAAKYPFVEMLHKSGMTMLCGQVLNGRADMRIIRPAFIKSLNKNVRKSNPSFENLYALKKFNDHRLEFDNETLEMFNNVDVTRLIFKAYEMTKQSPKKLLRYLKNINEKFWEYSNSSFPVGSIYIDYLTMLNKLKISPDTEIMAFPKDLKKAHDDAVKMFNAIQEEEKQEMLKKLAESLKKYNYESGTLVLVAPTDINELINEGKSLHHCVGSYVDRVLRGETKIFFIRKTEHKEEPFYTLEFKGDEVIQCRGKYNAGTTQEIDEFVKDWKRWLVARDKRKERRNEIQYSQVQAMAQ